MYSKSRSPLAFSLQIHSEKPYGGGSKAPSTRPIEGRICMWDVNVPFTARLAVTIVQKNNVFFNELTSCCR